MADKAHLCCESIKVGCWFVALFDALHPLCSFGQACFKSELRGLSLNTRTPYTPRIHIAHALRLIHMLLVVVLFHVSEERKIYIL